MVEYGGQLRSAREIKGLTQKALADQLYVTRQTVSRWECGERYPDIITLKKLSQILSVSLDDLLSGKEMTKVAEKNPVVESKIANNVTIAIYMNIVLLRLIEQVQYLMERYGMQGIKRFDYGIFDFRDVFGYTIEALYIVIFSYGLYCAIKNIQTPKRIGIVLISYSLTFLIDGFFWSCSNNIRYLFELYNGSYRSEFYGEAFINQHRHQLLWEAVLNGLRIDIPYYGPAIMMLISLYFFFIRGSKRKLWVYAIMIVSIWYIYYSVRTDITWMLSGRSEVIENTKYTVDNATLDSIFIVRDFFTNISLYGLIIFQTFTLYRKRKNAFDLSGEKEIDQVTA